MLAPWSPLLSLLPDAELGVMGRSATGSAWSPAVDITETEGAFVLEAEVPGVDPENIDVTIEGNMLTLRAERRYESDQSEQGYRRIERSYGSFQRSFTLPETVDRKAIDATIENGVLRVTLPKSEASLPRRVQVRAGKLADKAKKLFTGSSESSRANA